MSTLPRFDTPARLLEPTTADAEAWSDRVAGIFAAFRDFPQLYNPTIEPTPADAAIVTIAWNAFPARLLRGATSEEQRWERADSSRDEQDEYCEWSVERDGDLVARVTFTSEVPEYFEHVAERDPGRLVTLYSELVGRDVAEDELLVDGRFVRSNVQNLSTEQRLAHLVQENNNLEAAITLVAAATVPREENGVPVTTKQALAMCAGLGNPFRNSDPQIAAIVNGAARAGDELTLLDPIGLYIGGINTTGMVAPDGADPATFWTIERGDAEHTLRARFEVPPEQDRGYVAGHVTAADRRIRWGAQLADRITVRIRAVVKRGDHNPRPQPCGRKF